MRLLLIVIAGMFGILTGNIAYAGHQPTTNVSIIFCVFFVIWTIGTCSHIDPDTYNSTGNPLKLWVAVYPIVFLFTLLVNIYINL
jgi:hypothetical protein